MKSLLSTTAIFLALAAFANAADGGRMIAVDCPINDCDSPVRLTFAGEYSIDTGTMIDGVEFGGISGIDYDARTGRYIAISDDRSQKAPARFYALAITASQDGIADVAVLDTVTLQDQDGTAFAEKSVDPEQIRILGDRLVWASEGDGKAMIPPFIRIASHDGAFEREFSLPEGFAPSANQTTGIRNNNAFESIALLPSGDIIVANEAALYQDGPASSLTTASPTRLVRYDAASGQPVAQYVYMIDPIPHAPVNGGEWNDNGLSDLLALDDTHLLAAERSFAENRGFTIRIFMVDLDGATDVHNIPSLSETDQPVVPVAKSMILDLGAIGIAPDNIEAMTLGKAEDGSPMLVLASDNNFNSDQKTQFLAFTIEALPGEGAVLKH